MESATPKIEVPKTEETKNLSLPKIDEPAIDFNKDTKMFWVGIPIDKVRPFEATVLLDRVKFDYMQAFQILATEAQSKIQKADPGVLNQLRHKFLRETKRA